MFTHDNEFTFNLVDFHLKTSTIFLSFGLNCVHIAREVKVEVVLGNLFAF